MRKKMKIYRPVPAKAGIWLSFIAILLGFASLSAKAADKPLTVLELYTSQGCPGCPAADRIFEDIVKNEDNVIALGCHVTYFDRRWKDPMSRIFCDARQGAYRSAGVTRKLYTPQAVINGSSETIGSHEDDLRRNLGAAHALEPIGVTMGAGVVNIELPEMMLQKATDVWLFTYDRPLSQRIEGGANIGKTITYARPVANLTKLLAWNGEAKSMALPIENYKADGYAVIAQYADYTDIVAAGKTGN